MRKIQRIWDLTKYYFNFRTRRLKNFEKNYTNLEALNINELKCRLYSLKRSLTQKEWVISILTIIFSSVIIGSFGNNILKWLAGFSISTYTKNIKNNPPTPNEIHFSIQLLGAFILVLIVLYLLVMGFYVHGIANNKSEIELIEEIIKEKTEN